MLTPHKSELGACAGGSIRNAINYVKKLQYLEGKFVIMFAKSVETLLEPMFFLLGQTIFMPNIDCSTW